MEQQKALTALYPFLALSKSASSPRQAADVVTQATSAPNTFVFGELLQTPAVQSLREDAQHSPHYRLLELFTWGTWAEYTAASSASLPPLSPAQTHKLRLLTLLSLASGVPATATDRDDDNNDNNAGPALSYASLTAALGLSSSAELEQLVTSAIYADLVSATLDPARATVVVSAVAALRDPRPGSVVADMAPRLAEWVGRCDSVLAEMEERVEAVRKGARREGEWGALVAGQRERAERKWGARNGEGDGARGGDWAGSGSGQGLQMGRGDAMDVDHVGQQQQQQQHASRPKRNWLGSSSSGGSARKK